ncbi:MotA/TolQ/ExbB proton channel family protein [Apibacter raozihei]|uniref:MotA/TolQ/ExbB proton channel family protein n=1 Tax=Apibacter TaxID=1778601 RepID=UPI000FE3537C|nr:MULTISPECIES: MotA/TolQ/ExbB proton channel family protein [Apibacter]
MNDSLKSVQALATQTGEIKTTHFNLIEMLTHGGPVGIFVMICLFALFVISLYIFFERFLTIRKFSNKKSTLLNDVRDFIHEGKIDAALDLCKRTHTPEGRVLYKGIMRIGKPTRDISDAIENTAQLEIFELEKNVGVLGTISGAAPMLGFLGTVVGMIIAFFATSSQDQASAQMLAGGIYSAMANTAAGLIVGLLAYLFYNILVIKIDRFVYSLQLTAIDFLDILNKPVTQS